MAQALYERHKLTTYRTDSIPSTDMKETINATLSNLGQLKRWWVYSESNNQWIAKRFT